MRVKSFKFYLLALMNAQKATVLSLIRVLNENEG